MPKFENTPSSKVQFRALGETPLPGTCLVCGNGNCEEGYVDFGVWLEYIGEGLICATCLTESAELIGMLLKEEVAVIQHTADSLLVEKVNLRAELDAANERLAAFDLLFDRARDSLAGASSIIGPGASEGVYGTDGKSAARESEPKKPIKGAESKRSGKAPTSDVGDPDQPALIEL